MSHDPANDYFADGLTDELIRNLSIIDGLAPRSRTSSFAFRGKAPSVRKVGKQLAAYYLGTRRSFEVKCPPSLGRNSEGKPALEVATAAGRGQLISGHASKKSLEVYQHLSLAQVEPGYQRAVKSLEI